MEVRKMKTDHHNDHDQSRSEETHQRTERKRARRWDAILIGVGYSIVFVLLLTKVAQITPCEAVNYFSIDTNTCGLIGNANTIKGQLATHHGPSFDIIIQFALLVLEFSEGIVDHLQQFLQNSGLL